MGLFKKRKEVKEETQLGSLPELPNLPELPPLPEAPKEEKLPMLPSFPQEYGETINNQIVKAAVIEENKGNLREQVIKPRTREISEKEMMRKSIADNLTRELPTRFRTERLPEAMPQQPIFMVPNFQHQVMIPRAEQQEKGNIFIQIDKFETALESFAEIRRKVGEISEMLKDIKSIKEKEDQELSEWEKEIETIKVRIDSIDSEIFKKV